jgi:hypothetical protein
MNEQEALANSLMHLTPSLEPKVPANAPRPFAPGEWVDNPDGSWSSEISVTVTDPRLNSGKPTIIPSLWIVDGKPVKVNEDTAVDFALKSGLQFNPFKSIEDAEKFATDREKTWQTMKPTDAKTVTPLYMRATQ